MSNRRTVLIDTDVEPAPRPTVVKAAPPQPKMEPLTHMAALAFVEMRSLKIERKSLSDHGKALVRLSKMKGYEIQRVPDARWGHVNSYDVRLMEEYFSDLGEDA